METGHRASRRPGGPGVEPAVRVALAGLAAAIVIAPLAARVPLSVLVLGLGAMALAAAVAISPPTAAYLLLATTPLIVGIERGVAIPVLRPNEALLLLVGGALVARGLVRLAAGHRLRPRVRAVDAPILADGLTSSLLPLLRTVARAGRSPATMFCTPWPCGVLRRVPDHRSSIRTERRRSTCCLWISVTVACTS